MRRPEQLRVGGVWLSSIVAWGGLSWEDRLDGGNTSASWTLEGVSGAWDHPAIRRGALVEIMLGPQRLWCGVLSEPDRVEWQMHATGLAAEGETATALDGGGAVTSNPTTAVNAAWFRGAVRWFDHAGWPSTAFDDNPEPNYLSALLGAVAEAQGKHWGVGPDGVCYLRSVDVEPSYRLAPGATMLAQADDDYISHLHGRYLGSGGSILSVSTGNDEAAARWGRREQIVDMTGRGILTPAAAASALSGILAQVGPRPQFASGIEVDRWDLTTMGGTPANLRGVRPGEKVRMYGVVGQTGEPWQDWTIGTVKHAQGSDAIELEPQGIAARNLEAVMEEALT